MFLEIGWLPQSNRTMVCVPSLSPVAPRPVEWHLKGSLVSRVIP